jgi:hypothetical protein
MATSNLISCNLCELSVMVFTTAANSRDTDLQAFDAAPHASVFNSTLIQQMSTIAAQLAKDVQCPAYRPIARAEMLLHFKGRPTCHSNAIQLTESEHDESQYDGTCMTAKQQPLKLQHRTQRLACKERCVVKLLLHTSVRV